MIKKIKNYWAMLMVVTAFAVPVMVPAAVMAQNNSEEITGPLCSGVELEFNTEGQGCDQAQASGDSLSELIKTVINIISVIVGVIAVIMIIFGGLKYITSGGDSSNVSSAKNTIIYAIVGLVIVALAQFIVRFVLGKSIEATQ